MRQRPLQPTKRIRVIHLSPDGSFTSETGERVAANMFELDDCVSDDVILRMCATFSVSTMSLMNIHFTLISDEISGYGKSVSFPLFHFAANFL